MHGQVAAQVRGGAYGLFIVDGKQKGDYDDHVEEFLTNRKIERRLQVTNTGLANGVMGGAQVKMVKDQWHYVRILHVIPSGKGSAKAAFTAAAQANCDVYDLGSDGVYYSTMPYQRRYEFEVHAAQRMDFAVRCRSEGAFDAYTFDDNVVAKFTVESGEKGEETPFVDEDKTWTPVRPAYLTDLMDGHYPSYVRTPIDNTPITLSSDMTINGALFSEEKKTKAFPYGVEYIQEFTVTGSSAHPWHLHQQHFQVVQEGGCGLHKYGEWYDTIVSDKACTVRTRFVDFSGMIMHHCHELNHEDQGMMGWFWVPQEPGSFETSHLYEMKTLPFELPQCKKSDSTDSDSTDNDSTDSDSTDTSVQHALAKGSEGAGVAVQIESAPVYPWIIMGVSLFIAVGALAFAVWTVHRNSNPKESVVTFDELELGGKVFYPDLTASNVALVGTPVVEPFAP